MVSSQKINSAAVGAPAVGSQGRKCTRKGGGVIGLAVNDKRRYGGGLDTDPSWRKTEMRGAQPCRIPHPPYPPAPKISAVRERQTFFCFGFVVSQSLKHEVLVSKLIMLRVQASNASKQTPLLPTIHKQNTCADDAAHSAGGARERRGGGGGGADQNTSPIVTQQKRECRLCES